MNLAQNSNPETVLKSARPNDSKTLSEIDQVLPEIFEVKDK